MRFTRYAIYYLPPRDAAWARLGRGWLGWDIDAGEAAPRPDLPALPLPIEEITRTPRRYGLHATLKPPFRLAPDTDAAGLAMATRDLARTLSPVTLDGLRLTRLGRFLALCAQGDAAGINGLAAACVARLDPFRAPPDEAEMARRRSLRLSPGQETNLARWGYPHVMEAFRFHITLTGRLPGPVLPEVEAALADLLVPHLSQPVTVGDIALAGEREDGYFQTLHRFPLGGEATR